MSLTAYCPPSIHLSFDKYTQSGLQDDSGSGNDGLLANGAQIVPHGGKCGNAANLLGKIHKQRRNVQKHFVQHRQVKILRK